MFGDAISESGTIAIIGGNEGPSECIGQKKLIPTLLKDGYFIRERRSIGGCGDETEVVVT